MRLKLNLKQDGRLALFQFFLIFQFFYGLNFLQPELVNFYSLRIWRWGGGVESPSIQFFVSLFKLAKLVGKEKRPYPSNKFLLYFIFWIWRKKNKLKFPNLEQKC